MSIWTVLPCGAVISNRPFAHCCQIFTERNFPGAFFCFEKSKEIYFNFFVALICYKDIIANLSNFVKTYFKIKLSLSGYYTTIKAYFSKFVKSFLQIFPVRFTTASVSTYLYCLIVQASHGAWAKGLGQLYLWMFRFVKLTWPAGLSPSFVPLYIIGDVSVRESFLFTN